MLHAGDASYFGQPSEIEDFIDWFSIQPYTYKIFIAGNHDFGFEAREKGYHRGYKDGYFFFRGQQLRKGLEESYRQYVERKGVIYLHNEFVEVLGLKIYGSPYSPAFCNWAFGYPSHGMDAEEIYSKIPDDIDVLVTHSPPLGTLDVPGVRAKKMGDGRLGCPVLAQAVARIKPRLHVFGHIHESAGKKKVGRTTYVNAAICGIPYTDFNEPITVTLKV